MTFYGKLVGKYTVRHMDHNGFGHVLGVSGSSEYGDRWLEAGSSLQPSDIRRHSFGEAACKADIDMTSSATNVAYVQLAKVEPTRGLLAIPKGELVTIVTIVFDPLFLRC